MVDRIEKKFEMSEFSKIDGLIRFPKNLHLNFN